MEPPASGKDFALLPLGAAGAVAASGMGSFFGSANGRLCSDSVLLSFLRKRSAGRGKRRARLPTLAKVCGARAGPCAHLSRAA